MSDGKYAIGIDFGTESGRALLVDVATGREVATAVHPYANGVIDEALPGSGIRLEPDWALQDPNDYVEVLKHAVPAVLRQSGVDPADVIGIGIDFTACTILPVTARRHAALLPAGVPRPAPRLGQAVEASRRAARGQQAQRHRRTRGLCLSPPLRRQDQLRVVRAQGVADRRRGSCHLRGGRPHHRSGGLDHLADDRRGEAQPYHRRLQEHLAQA